MAALGESLSKKTTQVMEVVEQAKKRAPEPRAADGTIPISLDELFQIQEIADNIERHSTAIVIIPRNFIVSLVSQFDAFMGRLMRAIFLVRPDLLRESQKNLTFAQLLQFGTIEQAREFILEKEIESLLRESHAEQFAVLEKKLEMPLRKDLASWPAFTEVTERRNLFVHCDGFVSSQYLAVCESAKSTVDAKLGQRIGVAPDYFKGAYNIVFEIGVKLGHVLWRKLVPDDRAAADKDLNQIGYQLLSAAEFDLAKMLLEFALDTLKKYSSEEIRLFLLINLCIAYDETASGDKVKLRLASVDWSATSDKFKLAVATLEGRENDVFGLMRKIGTRGEVEAWSYRRWPLFRKLRESTEFASVFEGIFGEPLHNPNREAGAAVENLLKHSEAAKRNASKGPNSTDGISQEPSGQKADKVIDLNSADSTASREEG